MINIGELRADIEAGTPGDLLSKLRGYDWRGSERLRVAYAAADWIERAMSREREYLAMREVLKKAHDTLHECTAVLSANDCETVAAVMADARKALGETQ